MTARGLQQIDAFIKLSRSFPSNEVLLIEENNYRPISVLKAPLFPPHRGSSHRKTLPTASATIKGFEVTRMIRKRQCLMLERVPTEEVRFVTGLSVLPLDESRRAGQSARRRCYCNSAEESRCNGL